MDKKKLVHSLTTHLREVGLELASSELVPSVKSPQVHNVSQRLTVECLTSSKVWPSLVFELHLGKYEEKVQAFLRCANEVEHSWITYHHADKDSEAVEEVVGRLFRRFIEPIESHSSIPMEALRRLESTPLPASLSASVTSGHGERLVISERSTGRTVGSYLFRNFQLYRSFHDELFDSSLMYFEPVSTHTFSETDRLQISPADWALLLQAWIAKDVLFNFPHLERSDWNFAEFGKQVLRIQRGIPRRFRNAYDSGLGNWVTRHDVSVRVQSREKWYPEGWQRDASLAP